MVNNPLVSIVICCHNRRNYLDKTLASVFAQCYKPVEIIVMDDGSTDGTDELIEGYGESIRYFWQESRGISAARTAASRVAEGDYIAYQDDDDLMPPDRINHLYQALQNFPDAIFATGDYALIDPQGNLTGERWLAGGLDEMGPPKLIKDGQAAVLWPKIPAVPHTTLFRTEYGREIDWFDPEFKYACSDADFLARLGRLGPIVYLRQVVSHYRRGHSAIWNDDLKANYSRLQLWDKHLRLIGEDNPELRQRLQIRTSMALKKIAIFRSQGVELRDPEYDKFIERGLSHLDSKDRLLLRWFSSVSLPAKNMIKKYILPSSR